MSRAFVKNDAAHEPPVVPPRAPLPAGTPTYVTARGKYPGEERRYSLVGVDEANAAAGRIAFTAPRARALLGRRVSEEARLSTAQGEEVLEIVAVEYGER